MEGLLMKWSWRLGRIAGIDVFMHVTFLLLLVWVGVSYYLQRHSWADAWEGIIFIIAVFGIVVLHELGHALTARRFGIQTRDITLLPIGGVARLERMPEEPRQELLVALAGPAVNVVLAIALFLFLGFAAVSVGTNGFNLIGGNFLVNMLWVNVFLAGFNLIPAFPMDGGRVLRALLAMRTDYVHATQTAAHVGQGIAILFGFVGLFINPLLVFIALFVWMGASSEASMVQIKSALAGIPVSRAMITRFVTLSPANTLEDGVRHILAGFQQDFPVVDGGRLVGVLTRHDLMKALAEKGGRAPVADAMQQRFETAEPAEMLERAFHRLQTCDCHTLPVMRGEHLVGMLTMDNVGELMMVQAAVRGARQSSRPSLA